MNYEGNGNQDNRYNDQPEIFSKPVKAGKRTYFFDVKATKGNDYYLTITESKKRFGDDGKFHYEKHKLFLYKEDFEKFADGLMEAVNFINQNNPGGPPVQHHHHSNGEQHSNHIAETNHNVDHNHVNAVNDVNFEDLGNR
ncbi:MAG: PUR family DNA/RNA-binding protein [Bacteroidota bacterium]|nr:PUR family DNA/RNA-binding protein [Bacteroidota bacterium]